MKALEAALDEEQGPADCKVDAELAQRSRQFLTDAEAAHAERRKQAMSRLKKSSSCLLTVDADELREACDAAKVAGVQKSLLNVGYELLKGAVIRKAWVRKTQAMGSSSSSSGGRSATR